MWKERNRKGKIHDIVKIQNDVKTHFMKKKR